MKNFKAGKSSCSGKGAFSRLFVLGALLLLSLINPALAEVTTPPQQQPRAEPFSPQSPECAPYRSNTVPNNLCSWDRSKQLGFERLSADQRRRLATDERVVTTLYDFARNASASCHAQQIARATSCNADNAARADRYRVALTQQMTQIDRNSQTEEQTARRYARETRERQEREAAAERARAGAGGQQGGSAGSGSGSGSGGTSSSGSGGASGGTGSSGSTVAAGPSASSPGCFDFVSESQRQGHVIRSARLATLIDRTILGVSARHAIEAATCIDQLWDKINQVTSAISAVVSSLNHPIVAVLAALAGQIVGQIIGQLINNVLNAVCEAAQQIAEGIENRLQNALCIEGDFGMRLDPFKFQIDIPALECQGWSVDLLTGGINGQPIEGLDVDFNSITRDAGRMAQNESGFNRAIQEAARTNTLTPQRQNEIYCQFGRPECRR